MLTTAIVSGRPLFCLSSTVVVNMKRLMSSSTPRGYQSIGSFHSENIEHLMSQSEEEYIPPQLPFESNLSPKQSFLLDRKEWTFLNHGAFGAALECGFRRSEEWRRHLEAQPLRYFDRDLLPHLVYSSRQLAKFMSVEREGIALFPNVTSAMNSIVSGYARHYKDAARILIWDVTYGSVKKIAKAYCNDVVEIELLKHLQTLWTDGESAFVQAFNETLSSSSEDWSNALLILDQTTSNTAINFPIETLAKLAKRESMFVVVDGAHGLLAQPIDFLQRNLVDIYVANGHKWLACPRGVGVMYCPHEGIRETILRQPAIVSHGIDDGYFSRFIWDGCRDYTSQLSLPMVLDTWRDPPAIRSQLKESLLQGSQILQSMWHSDGDTKTTLAPMSFHSPMALVRLPESLAYNRTSAHAKQIQDYLFYSKIEVPIKCIQGTLYVRVSCHVYNTPEDFEQLGKAILQYEANSNC